MPRLPVNTGASAMDMAETIFGDDVTIVSADYNGQNSSSGIYTNGDSVSPGVTPSDEGVILSTGHARNFSNRWGGNNQRSDRSTDTSGENNNPEFNAVAGTNTYDASYLDVSFIANEAGQMTMQFVFASEEYPEYVDHKATPAFPRPYCPVATACQTAPEGLWWLSQADGPRH